MNLLINDAITLTPFSTADVPNMVKYLNDEEVYNNTLKIPKNYGERDAHAFLKMVEERQQRAGQQTEWSIRHREEGLIGGIGRMILYGVEAHKDEIGYWLAKPFRRQGIMSAVVQRFSDFCIQERKLARVEARAFSHNVGSRKVLERAGFRQEGYMNKCEYKNGVFIDCYLYARIAGLPTKGN
ncbi:MAG: GNAT family N-acetyltransferase [Bacteroidota bacterium]